MSNWTGNLEGLYHEGESAPDHLQQLFLPLSIGGYEPASWTAADATHLHQNVVRANRNASASGSSPGSSLQHFQPFPSASHRNN